MGMAHCGSKKELRDDGAEGFNQARAPRAEQPAPEEERRRISNHRSDEALLLTPLD